MSMTIPTTAISGLLGVAADQRAETVIPAEPGPRWSLTGNFDDRDFAASIGARPILASGSPPLAA